MIVDCHTHIECPGLSISSQEHIEACQKVSNAFVLASCAEQTSQSNSKVSNYISKNDKMIGFAVVNPVEDKIDTKSISELVDKGKFKGLVLYCCEHNFHPCHSKAMNLYEIAEKLKLPVFFHNMPPYSPVANLAFAQPMLLDELASAFAGLKIIIGGMGFPFVNQTVCMLNKHPNVLAGLTVRPERTWETYNTVLQAYEADVMDKLIFGSGFPSATVQSCMETLLGFNSLLVNTNLPTVPRERIRSVIEKDTLSLIGIKS